MLKLEPRDTALVLIDLQKGIVARDFAPNSADQVVNNASRLADLFRQARAAVVLVSVAVSKDFKDALRQPVDQPPAIPPGGFPE